MCTPYRSPRAVPVERLLSRRGFLRAGAITAATGASIGALHPRPLLAQALPGDAGCVPTDRISIQLYTLRDVMAEDLDGVFEALAQLGYRKVEHAGYDAAGSVEEFKAALDRHGLHATSGHQGVPYPYNDADWEQKIEDALTLGQTRMVEPLPYFALAPLGADIVRGQVSDTADLSDVDPLNIPSAVWADYAQTLNHAAEVAAAAGIRVGYHNHNPEFFPLPDDPSRTGYDVLLAETDPDLVHFEMDLYWVWAAEVDPVPVLRAHPGRFQQFHVKDMAPDGSITAPGTGIIDFDRIFVTAGELGIPIDEYIIEQDNAGQDAVESARLGYELLEATCIEPASTEPSGSADDGSVDEVTTTADSLPATGGGSLAAGLGAVALATALRLRGRTSS